MDRFEMSQRIRLGKGCDPFFPGGTEPSLKSRMRIFGLTRFTMLLRRHSESVRIPIEIFNGKEWIFRPANGSTP